MEFQTLKQANDYINEIPRFTSKHTMDHTKRFMEILGNPQETFETIHVAGSNGKGSTCAMISSALIEAGKKTGLFISPHLVTITERFQINGDNCSDEIFVQATNEVLKAIDVLQEEGLEHPTFFEMIFAIGMVIFQKEKVDIAVIETGLGGLLDTTNVLKKPLVCVITSISLEHTEYLGNTLEEIATQKAGIIKDGVPVVFDAKHDKVNQVIFQKAMKHLAPTYPVYPGDIEILRIDKTGLEFRFDLNKYKKPISVPFPAKYQAENASLAMQALEILIGMGYLTYDDLVEGFAKTKWPGRMQKLEKNVYLDGAHNVDGMRQFLASAPLLCEKAPHLLYAMVKEKDYEQVAKDLMSQMDWEEIVVTEIPGGRILEASILADILEKEAKQQGKTVKVLVKKDVKEAFLLAKSHAKEMKRTLFITGSLYLAGMILEEKEVEADD